RGAEGRGLQAVLAGNLVVQILSFAVAYRTMTLGAGAGVYPAFAIHTVLGACYAFFLAKSGRSAA
ncbi:MAG TPA: hypothetical protein VL980_04660, partial [Gemmatimonadaceae bacterium]|nr:hypothetical protein [Gemmatimonadaceae bacterium]